MKDNKELNSLALLAARQKYNDDTQFQYREGFYDGIFHALATPALYEQANLVSIIEFMKEPVNFLLTNALKHLSREQQRGLVSALGERCGVTGIDSITLNAAVNSKEKGEQLMASLKSLQAMKQSFRDNLER